MVDFESFTLSLKTFFDSNHVTLKTYLNDSIDGNEQCWSKITFKKGLFVSDQSEKQ